MNRRYQITPLQERYAKLVTDCGLAMPKEEPNTPWSSEYSHDVATGLAENGSMYLLGAIVGIGSLAGPMPRELTKEIESAIRPWYTPAKEVFAGEFPTGRLNAQLCIFPEGYLILINREIIQLISDFVDVINALRLQFMPGCRFSIVPEEKAFGAGFNDIFVKSVAAILLHHMHRLSRNEANAYIKQLKGWARRLHVNNSSRGDPNDSLFEFGYPFQVVKACLSFIIAHEYGHIIAGHLNPPRTARIRMAHGELTVATEDIDQEREADNLASQVLQSVLEHRYHLKQPDFPWIEAMLILAGPPLFFCIDAAIQHASAEVSAHETHPPPEERLRQHDAFFKKFRSTPDLFLLADVYSSWLTPTLEVLPQSIDQLECIFR